MADVWLSRLHSARILRVLRWGSIVVPLCLAAVSAAVLWRAEVGDARRQAELNASLLRDLTSRLIQAQDVMLTAADAALDHTGLAANGGWEAHRFLADMQARLKFSVGVALVSPEGDFLLSNRAHPPQGNVGPREYLTAPYDEQPLFVDHIQIEPGAIDALVVARRRTAAPLPGVWVAGVRIEALEDFLVGVVDRKESVALILRDDGRVLLRRPEVGSEVELDESAPEMRALGRARSGVFEATSSLDGTRRIYAFARLDDAPLYVLYGASKGAILAQWLKNFAGVMGVLGALSFVGFGLARSASRSVEAEAAQAALVFNRQLLAEANKTAQAREMMLRELNHRVKNSLQMIRSLVRLQAQRPQGPDLDAVVSRVMAIATIHDLLYRSASSFEIDLASLLEQILASDAIVPPESRIVIEHRLERLTVDANVATPLALCAIELVTNAVKHGFGSEGGTIAVTLRRDGQGAVMTICDDGCGFPDELERRSGLRVVDALVLQLGGSLRVRRDGGARFEITFPLEEDAPSGDKPHGLRLHERGGASTPA